MGQVLILDPQVLVLQTFTPLLKRFKTNFHSLTEISKVNKQLTSSEDRTPSSVHIISLSKTYISGKYTTKCLKKIVVNFTERISKYRNTQKYGTNVKSIDLLSSI